MPFCPPGEKLRQRNLRARTYQHGPRVSREAGRPGEKNAFPRICGYRGPDEPWQNSPAPGSGGGRIRSPKVVFTGAPARICAHFPSKIYRNLPKNPVNLPVFIEFYGNSVSFETKRSAPPSYRNPPNPREPQMRGNARASRWGRIHSGQGGKASREFPAGPGREGRRAASPAYPVDAKTRLRQMRANAWAVCPADGLCHHRRLTVASLSQRFFRFTKACGIRQRSIRRP